MLADTIKIGTILIAEGALLPASLSLESEPYAYGWRLIKNLDGKGLNQIIRNLPDICRVKCDACGRAIEIEYSDYGDVNRQLVVKGWRAGSSWRYDSTFGTFMP